uniref:FAD assembly factor SdhE n=1 Tax=Rhizochromulina marina TaxID=1034831 RepID=A0A7S2R8F6_9STRA
MARCLASGPDYGLEQSLARRAAARDHQMRSEHFALKTDVPVSSLAPGETRVDGDTIRRKRLIYRSKQRGWLEVDLLMGTWAVEHVPSLSSEELDQYEALLNRETIDIFNIVTGKDVPPPEVESPLLKKIQAWANTSPIGTSPESYASVKGSAGLT